MTKAIDAEVARQENTRSTASLIQRFATCLPWTCFIYFVVKTSASWQRARHLKGTSQSCSQIRSFVGRAIKIRTRRRRGRFLSRGGDVARAARLFVKKSTLPRKGLIGRSVLCSICIAIILNCGLGGPSTVIVDVKSQAKWFSTIINSLE